MSGFLTARETIPPERLLFARGCRGGIVRSIQQRLQTARAYGGVNDGIYGARTESGVSEFQRRNGLAVTGNVDGRTWSVLMERSIPSVFERALLLTAAFEGHGYGTVRGNWDGAWLTWGIVGFTWKHGEIGRILLTAAKLDPNLLASAFAN